MVESYLKEISTNFIEYHLQIKCSKSVKRLNDSGSLIVNTVNIGEHKINRKKLHPIKFCNFTLPSFEPFCLNVFDSIKSQRVLI